MHREVDIGGGRVMREGRRDRRGHDLVDRRHRWDELAPGGRILGGNSRYVIRQACLWAGAQTVVNVTCDARRRCHVLVGRGHRVRRHRDVGEVIRRRFTESFIASFKAAYYV